MSRITVSADDRGGRKPPASPWPLLLGWVPVIGWAAIVRWRRLVRMRLMAALSRAEGTFPGESVAVLAGDRGDREPYPVLDGLCLFVVFCE